jgi:cation transport regulator ChaC
MRLVLLTRDGEFVGLTWGGQTEGVVNRVPSKLQISSNELLISQWCCRGVDLQEKTRKS